MVVCISIGHRADKHFIVGVDLIYYSSNLLEKVYLNRITLPLQMFLGEYDGVHWMLRTRFPSSKLHVGHVDFTIPKI